MRHLCTRALALLLLLAGCGGSGGSGAATGSPVARVFLKDAPASGLDTFTVSISKVGLLVSGGGEVVLFSGAPVTENLLDLRMLEKLIGSATIPTGTYTGLAITITAIGATAAGTPQSITLAGGLTLPWTIQVSFEQPLVVTPGVAADISLDIDVAASVSDGGGNAIVVQLVALAEVELESSDAGEVEGKIVSVDPAAGTITVVSEDEAGDDPAGSFSVQLTASTVVELGDAVLQGAAALASLASGLKVEVKGPRSGATITADTIELRGSGSGSSNVLGFEGLVTSRTTGGPGGSVDTATVSLLNVKNDPSGALSGLSSVTVDLTQSPLIVATLGGAASAADIDLGEKILVQGTKAGAAVVASAVFLEQTRFRGTVTTVGSGTLTVGPLTAERLPVPGLTSRTFDVPAATPLSLEGVVPLPISGLAVGQQVELKAALDVRTSHWVALQIEVEAGDFEGTGAGLSSVQATSFVMTGDGTGLGLANPVTLTVTVSPATRIALVQGTTTSLVPMADLASTLGALPSTAKVEVEGVLTGVAQLSAVKIVLKP